VAPDIFFEVMEVGDDTYADEPNPKSDFKHEG